MFESQHKKKGKRVTPLPRITVIGIGGGGGNAVSRMSRDPMRGVEFVAINTDHQDLDHSNVRNRIYIGKSLTGGLGTGMNPELGRQAAEENRSEISELVKGSDMVFLAAGFGGGTGTGATPVVAEIAKQNGALTFAFVTRPFAFEGNQRERIAQEGLSRLKDKVDALVIVPNDRIFSIVGKDTPIVKAFEAIDDVLKNALKGIVEMIVLPGMVNVDFADVRAVMQDAGSVIVGLSITSGQDRAVNAVNQALNSPLIDVSPEGAKGILLGISGRDLKMNEINEAARLVAQTADPSAKIIFGAYYDRRLRPNQIKVTLIATGLNSGGGHTSLFGGAKERVGFLGDIRGGNDESVRERAEPRGGREEIQIETFEAKQTGTEGAAARHAAASAKKESGWDIDIPAFLRKKKKRN